MSLGQEGACRAAELHGCYRRVSVVVMNLGGERRVFVADGSCASFQSICGGELCRPNCGTNSAAGLDCNAETVVCVCAAAAGPCLSVTLHWSMGMVAQVVLVM